MWVGLSAVQVSCTESTTPLASSTNTGGLIYEVEQSTESVSYYKTNLVKCLPLKEDKMRYPNSGEMNSCYGHLENEIAQLRPKVVFLLGKQVASFVLGSSDAVKFSDDFKYKAQNIDGTVYVPVHHPSYMLVYKRKKLSSYIKGISKMIAAHT